MTQPESLDAETTITRLAVTKTDRPRQCRNVPRTKSTARLRLARPCTSTTPEPEEQPAQQPAAHSGAMRQQVPIG